MTDSNKKSKQFSAVAQTAEKPVLMTDPMQVLSSGSGSNPTIVLKADYIGASDDALSHQLLQELMTGLLSLNEAPEAIIFYHQAVKLLLADSPVIAALKKLQQEGTELVACELSMKTYANNEPVLGFKVSFCELVLQLSRAKNVLWF